MQTLRIYMIEGREVPYLSRGLSPSLPIEANISIEMRLNKPTVIKIGGVRVTEPTQVIRLGRWVATDLAGTEEVERRSGAVGRERIIANFKEAPVFREGPDSEGSGGVV